MNILFSDIDNTLVYSLRKIHVPYIGADVKNGTVIGGITAASAELLNRLSKKIEIVPITARSLEQYRRIVWPCPIKYAMALNGAVLLVNGVIDEAWYNETMSIVKSVKSELERAAEVPGFRWVDDIYVYAHFENHDQAQQAYDKFDFEPEKVKVYVDKCKVYVTAAGLSKKDMVRKFLDRYDYGHSYSAGDSEVDREMEKITDMFFKPDATYSDNFLKQIDCREL